MNTPESLVTSLHWSKELQKAGWPQGQSIIVHSTTSDGYSNHSCHVRLDPGHPNFGSPFYLEWAAPTAEEILRRLPHEIEQTKSDDDSSVLQCGPTPNGKLGRDWHVWYWDFGYGDIPDRKLLYTADTLANAAAAMYCYLAENGLLPKA